MFSIKRTVLFNVLLGKKPTKCTVRLQYKAIVLFDFTTVMYSLLNVLFGILEESNCLTYRTYNNEHRVVRPRN